jgi:O-antigen/teichoic acid export membrane protein
VLLVLITLPAQVLRIFGPGYESGAPALRIVALGMIVPVMVGTLGFILIMAGRTGWDLAIYLAAFAIDVSLAFALARPEVLGVEGAAIAQACTLTFSAFARLFLVRRFLHIWPFDAAYLRLIVPTVVGSAVMLGVHSLVPEARWFINLVVAAAAGGGVYVALIAAIGLPPGERALLGRQLARLRGRSAAS